MAEKPKNLKTFARNYDPIILKSTPDDIEKLLALKVDLFVLEPTGSYAYIWLDIFKRNQRNFRLVSSLRVRHFCAYQGLTNKADKPDAAAICAYALENLENPEAFLKIERLRVRQIYLRMNSLVRNKNPIQNQLGQILSYEAPSMVKAHENASRDWLKEQPPAIWRYIAKESMADRAGKRTQTIWDKKLDDNIGTGLSQDSQDLAAHLCAFERMEYRLETELAQELDSEEFRRYQTVLDRFEVPAKIRAAILSRIYPFEDFLQDGRAIKEYVNGSETKRRSGKTKRDRSEAAFKLNLGNGLIESQSGKSTEWKPGGSKYARTAIWQYIKVKIVIGRSNLGGTNANKKFSEVIVPLLERYDQKNQRPWLNEALIMATAIATQSSPEIASLRLHFEFNGGIYSTCSRFCRMLYKQLLKEFSQH